MSERPSTTSDSGAPAGSDDQSLTVGPNGPIVLHDHYLIEQMAQFNRERIPERQPHAKGSGAFGTFETTGDVSVYTCADFLQPGRKTELVARFSSVAGERGSPDTWRDPRGFSLKFYTDEGNYDMVGNNTPVFFMRDPLKFQHFIRSQKRRADNNLRDHDMQWDFWTLSPETAHQVAWLMGDRGTPSTWRHMNGYSSHTYLWVNADGVKHWVKYHFISDQGIEFFTQDEADAINDGAETWWNVGLVATSLGVATAAVGIVLVATVIGYFIIRPSDKLPIYHPAQLDQRLVDPSLKGAKGEHHISDFHLTDQFGGNFTLNDVGHRIIVADFFFTTCATICPKMSAQMERVQEAYKTDDRLILLSHSVTPEMDSVPALAAYAELHRADHNRWRFLTVDVGYQHIFTTGQAVVTGRGAPPALVEPEPGPPAAAFAALCRSGAIIATTSSMDSGKGWWALPTKPVTPGVCRTAPQDASVRSIRTRT